MGKPAPKPVVLTSAAALKTAVERVLRPLVGLLLENGLTYPWLSSLLKSIFVDVAEREFRLPDKPQTDSRINLLTGVHRKDVRRLRANGEDGDDQTPPANVHLGAYLVAIWTSDSRFLDADGQPKALSRYNRSDGPCFEDLVTSVNKDIRPRVVLDEWLRLGAVELDANSFVTLKTEAFVPSRGFDEKVYYLGRNVHDHIAAARHNVQENGPPLLERSVYYDNLSADSVREIEEMARRDGMELLQRLNRKARELQAADEDHASKNYRINLGVYFYRARQTEEIPED